MQINPPQKSPTFGMVCAPAWNKLLNLSGSLGGQLLTVSGNIPVMDVKGMCRVISLCSQGTNWVKLMNKPHRAAAWAKGEQEMQEERRREINDSVQRGKKNLVCGLCSSSDLLHPKIHI